MWPDSRLPDEFTDDAGGVAIPAPRPEVLVRAVLVERPLFGEVVVGDGGAERLEAAGDVRHVGDHPPHQAGVRLAELLAIPRLMDDDLGPRSLPGADDDVGPRIEARQERARLLDRGREIGVRE